MIDEGADRWQRSLPVGNESRDRGIASEPGGQHPPQCSRSNFFAADVTGQRDNAEAGDCGLLVIMSSLNSRGVNRTTTSSFALLE